MDVFRNWFAVRLPKNAYSPKIGGKVGGVQPHDLKPDTARWLTENCKFPWVVEWQHGYFEHHDDDSSSFGTICTVRFRAKRDAALALMFLGGQYVEA